MPRKVKKVIVFSLCFLLLFEQSGFAQIAGQLDVSGYINQLRSSLTQDKFRPLHLRYLSYDSLQNNFKLLLDKGDQHKKGQSPAGTVPMKELQDSTRTLLKYFFVGVTLPNNSFWVNLRPDSPKQIIDDFLAETDVGKILLEADLQLKKDTARFTSPQTQEGRAYWDKLYKKAGELFGSDNVTIPTLTRPWIVPDEIIIRETDANAYIYKATLKVQLEQDYLSRPTISGQSGSRQDTNSWAGRGSPLGEQPLYVFDDERLKQLNEYSSQLIRELIIPKLTKEVNTAKRYAPLRQVYYSLILAQWFKARFSGKSGIYSWLIDRKNLTGLTSQKPWSTSTYFKAYQKSFKDGEYNIKEPISTAFGQAIRSYFSGGANLAVPIPLPGRTSAGVTSIVGNPARELPQNKLILGLASGGTAEDPVPQKIELTVKQEAVTATPSPERQSELITRAEEALGRSLRPEEAAAVQKTHDVGQGHYLGEQNPDGTYTKNENPDLAYTPEEIREKARILRQAGFSIAELDKLMRYGVAGNVEGQNQRRANAGGHAVTEGSGVMQGELLTPEESRRRLISDRLGIPLDQIPSWERANPQSAKRLEEMAEGDDRTEVFLKSIDSRNVVVDRNSPEFSHLYSEAEGVVIKLLKAAGFNPENFSFYLLDSTPENAFIIRYSNKIFVNIGLIKFIVENGGSKDALAFVLAHEIRHILQWVDDTIQGKPLERGIGGLVSGHADEYDADYALALIDKAGYSVRDAGFFFAKFIEKKSKKGHISLGFLTHPPTIERLRKIERDVLKFFWMNFFNKSEQFSDATKQEINNRTTLRRFQELVAQSNTPQEFERYFNIAQSPEDFIFVLMIAWQKGIHVDINNAYNRLLNKFGIAEQGKKEFYRIIFDILKIDLDNISRTRQGLGIIIRGATEASSYAVHNLEPRFTSFTISELIELLSIEILRPVEFDSYNVKLTALCDFNYAAYASAFCHALGKRVEELYRSGAIADAEQLFELMRLFQQRHTEIATYIQQAVPPDVKGALEKMIVILLKVMNEQAKAGHTIPEKHINTMLYFLDLMEYGASYSEGEDAIKTLCEFMKNASIANKQIIVKWLNKGDAESRSKFRDYIFEYMAKDVNFLDILPGMGRGAEADLGELFSNPYFVKHSIFSDAHITAPGISTRLNILIATLSNLRQKYNLSAEETAALFGRTMAKLRALPLDSRLERLYEQMYREIISFDRLKISEAITRRVEHDYYGIPKDLSPNVKKLIYFYKMGGVFSFAELRFHTMKGKQSVVKREDVEEFYNVLISLSKEIKTRYQEKEDSTRELRWNKYVLPFALFLSFDQQALSEEESRYDSTAFQHSVAVIGADGKPVRDTNGELKTESVPGKPTRFGRFIGEFNLFNEVTRFTGRGDFQKAKVARGRGINRVFLTGENVDVLLQVFDYIVTSDKDFETLLREISRALPATAYRNFALYILFVEKFLKRECGVSIDVIKLFDLGYIQNIIGNLDPQARKKALQILGRVSALMARDTEMEQLNEPNQNVLGKLEDAEKQRISAEHASEEKGYYPFEFTESGGALSQLDIFVGLLAENNILEALKSTGLPFNEKLDLILKHFTRNSNTRDHFLTLLIENNLNTALSADIEQVLSLFNNEGFREKYAVMALEKKRNENSAEFSTLEGELKWILHYFPKLSPTRDDILLQLIDEKANTPSDTKKVRPYLLRAPENIREKKQARVVFGTSMFEEYMSGQNAADKMEFLLWALGISDKKPFFLRRFEHEYNVSLNGMRDNFMKRKLGYYKNAGDSAMEEFLEKILLGENGIFYDERVSSEFLGVLFNTLMPGQKNNIMRVLYDAVFRRADVNRKYAIVSALLNNFSKERGTPEGINEARAIRIFLGSLGLVGVKIAQFLSTYEAVSEEIRNELKLLRDRAPQLNKDIVFDMIAKIYGGFENSPVSEILECIGSASIKVVYRARLKDGREIVIKIKRPEVEKKVEEDLSFLRDILSDPVVKDALRDNGIEIPQQLGERIAEMILEEMDLRREVENQDKLREGINLSSSFRRRLSNIIFNYLISKVFKTPQNKYSFKIPVTIDVQNNTLIIEGFVNGKPVSLGDSDAVVAVARELMRQIFLDGFYHADPHTGNIFVGREGEVLYFIDAGSASKVSFKNRYILYMLIRALKSGNENRIAKIINKISGRRIDNVARKAEELARPQGDIIKKMLAVFKFLEDSHITIDKELMSVFRCFGQGESLFRSALLSDEVSASQAPASEDDTSRRRKAEEALGRDLSEDEFTAVQRAHTIGEGHFLGSQNPDGTFQKHPDANLAYTYPEIAQKARILEEAGFNQDERRKLMQYGVAGQKEPGAFSDRRADVNRRAAVDEIIGYIKSHGKITERTKSVAAKIESHQELNNEDREVLRDVYKRLVDANSLAALSLKVEAGDMIVTFNQQNIKFLNTQLGTPRTDEIIRRRQRVLIELLIEEGLINSEDEAKLLLNYKQDKFVIKRSVVARLTESELNQRLDKVTDEFSRRMTAEIGLKDFVFQSYYGISEAVSDSNDRARILADMQALQAAKIARRKAEEEATPIYGVGFEQTEFDNLMRMAQQIRGELKLGAGEMPSQEEMNIVRGKSEKELKGRELSVKKYLDIIDLFDYPKSWSADLAIAGQEKEGILRILEGLEHTIQGRAPPGSARERAAQIRNALVILDSNPKNPTFTSGNAFHYYAFKKSQENFANDPGRIIAADVRGFWGAIQQNLALAQQRYLENIDKDIATRRQVILQESLDADDKVKQNIQGKVNSLAGVLEEHLGKDALRVNISNGDAKLLVNQEGGDEIVFFIPRGFDLSVLAGELDKLGINVRVMAAEINPRIERGKDASETAFALGYTEVTHASYGEAYVSAQEADVRAKDLEKKGLNDAIVSEEFVPPQQVGAWFVYYEGDSGPIRESYEKMHKMNPFADYAANQAIIGNQLMAKPFVEYFEALRETVNPDSRPLTIVYGGNLADISSPWLCTHFTTAYFIDKKAVSIDKLQEHLETWVVIQNRSSSGYFAHKSHAGYTTYDDIKAKGVEFWIIQELKAMGVQKEDIEISLDDKNRIRLRFKLPQSDTSREIIFVQQDILELNKNAELNAELSGRVDVYFQKAGVGLPLKYKEYLPFVDGWLKPEGFLMINSYIYADYIMLPKPLVKSFKTVSLEKIEQLAETVRREVRRIRYGWYMTLLQKNPESTQAQFGGPSGGISPEHREAAIRKFAQEHPEFVNDLARFVAELDRAHSGVLEVFQTEADKRAEVGRIIGSIQNGGRQVEVGKVEEKETPPNSTMTLEEFRRRYTIIDYSIDVELPVIMRSLEEILALRRRLDESGDEGTPLIIWQNLRLGEMYPFFTQDMINAMGIREVQDVKEISEQGIEDFRKARFILIRAKKSSTPSATEDTLLEDQINRLSAKLGAVVLMIDSSKREFSDAQVRVKREFNNKRWFFLNPSALVNPSSVSQFDINAEIFLQNGQAANEEVIVEGHYSDLLTMARLLVQDAITREVIRRGLFNLKHPDFTNPPSNSSSGNPGGIDFRSLPIQTQPLNPLKDSPLQGQSLSPSGTVPVSEDEWQKIQNMLQAGIIPSGQRIKEYLENCCQKDNFKLEIDKVLGCIADILRLEEERILSTEPGLREFLLILESNKPANELKIALNNLHFLAKEPILIKP